MSITRVKSKQVSPGSWLALATVLLVDIVFSLNNFAPYLGLNYMSAMTMFSGLATRGDNHFFMPTAQFSDAGSYVAIARVDVRNTGTTVARQFQAFAEWTNSKRRLVHLNFVRYHASRICNSGHGVSMRLDLVSEVGEPIIFRNVCSEPAMLRYAVLSKYHECKPGCREAIRAWALGKTPAG